MYFDAHIHYPVCVKRNIFDLSDFYNNGSCNWTALSCAHSPEEWLIQEKAPDYVYKSFGIHPQTAGNINIAEYKDFLAGLAENKKLNAIGEAGFDLFSDSFKATKDLQEDIWNFQLELAIKYQLPLVVHCRKANEMLFKYSPLLKKVPAVLFHSFMGSFVEAGSLIKRQVNCFFSFGKQIMNNNKKVMDCVKNLPAERLLFETDGPFQTLKGEENTVPYDIIKIYKSGYLLRKGSSIFNETESYIDKLDNNSDFIEFSNMIYKNGKRLLNLL